MTLALSCYQTLGNRSASLPSLALHSWEPFQDTAAKLGGGTLAYSVTETRTTTWLAASYPRMRGEQRKEGVILRKMLTRLMHLPASAHGHSVAGPPSIPGLVSLALQPRGDSLTLSHASGPPLPEEHTVCIISDLCPKPHKLYLVQTTTFREGRHDCFNCYCFIPISWKLTMPTLEGTSLDR